MKTEIILFTGEAREGEDLCGLLRERGFQAALLHPVGDLEKSLRENNCRLLLIDLDTIAADKTLFRKIKTSQPDVEIIVLSSRSYHPELKEALSTDIYACLGKPVDQDELMYCITSLLNR